MDDLYEMEGPLAQEYLAGFVCHLLTAFAAEGCQDAEELLQLPDETLLATIHVTHLIENSWQRKVMQKLCEAEEQIRENQLEGIVAKYQQITTMLHIYVHWLNPEILNELDLGRNNRLLADALRRFFQIRHFIFSYYTRR